MVSTTQKACRRITQSEFVIAWWWCWRVGIHSTPNNSWAFWPSIESTLGVAEISVDSGITKTAGHNQPGGLLNHLMDEPKRVKISGHPHSHKLRSKQIAEDSFDDIGVAPLEAETALGQQETTSATQLMPEQQPLTTVITSATSEPMLADSSIIGKTTMPQQNLEIQRLTKLEELAQISGQHLVEIVTPDGTVIKPLRTQLQEVEAIQKAKTQRQRQSKVIVCSLY